MSAITLDVISERALLKQTTSRCTTCGKTCPGEVWEVAGNPPKVYMKRTCDVHGEETFLLSSDSQFYWLAKGSSCGGGTCCSPHGEHVGTLGKNAEGRGLNPVETLSTCLALIEIVHSCNLPCPTCYAGSPLGIGAKVDAVPLVEIKDRIEAVVRKKGVIDIIQLSGGEPTLHPDLFELLLWLFKHPKVKYVLLNTNGLQFTKSTFLGQMKEVFRPGKMQLYLQFDGNQENGHAELRGQDLRRLKKTVIENCGKINLPVTLAMTVTKDNLPHLWDTVSFAMEYPHVRGVSFQPMFLSGRNPLPTLERKKDALNTADVLNGLITQSKQFLSAEDFTPLPCGDPNCAIIGYLLKAGGEWKPVSSFVDFAKLQGFLKDKVHYTLEDLARCGCEGEPLGEFLKSTEVRESDTFRLMVKPFMDFRTWDEDRTDRCCTHVILPGGKLASFCAHYAGVSS